MGTVRLTFELDQEAIKSIAFLMGRKLTEWQLQQLGEKELLVNNDSEYLKNKELVVLLAATALDMLVEHND